MLVSSSGQLSEPTHHYSYDMVLSHTSSYFLLPCVLSIRSSLVKDIIDAPNWCTLITYCQQMQLNLININFDTISFEVNLDVLIFQSHGALLKLYHKQVLPLIAIKINGFDRPIFNFSQGLIKASNILDLV